MTPEFLDKNPKAPKAENVLVARKRKQRTAAKKAITDTTLPANFTKGKRY